MKLSTVLVMALAGTCSLPARADDIGQTVSIYVNNRSLAPQRITNSSQEIARKMFKAIGVHIKWHIGTPTASELEATRPIIITITGHTSKDFHPGELAAALPYEGVHIRILYDRLTDAAALPNMSAILLAHVLAHEISHILQGVARHSTAGVMRARWRHQDYLAMQSGDLAFDPVDVQLIQRGLAERAVRLEQRAVAASYTSASYTTTP